MEKSRIKKRIKFYFKYIHFRFFSKKGHLDNIYLATVQKAGSQWIRTIFEDKEVKKYTKMIAYPQHHYDGQQFHTRFPRYTFVPGLYIAYSQYKLFLKKPKNYRTIFIARDPRNVVVSWYRSTLETHQESPQIKLQREQLKNMSMEEGITLGIKILANKFAEIRTWYELAEKEDKHVMFIRFEDITKEPFKYFRAIFDFLKTPIPDKELETILEYYSKENMRKRDLETRKIGDASAKVSHYRKISSNYKDVFNEEHYKLFYGITGDLIDKLKYAK